MGYGSREEFYRETYLKNDEILSQEDLDRSIERAASTLTEVLDALRSSPLAPGIIVFGSMARGAFLPGDIDIAVDLRDVPHVEGGLDALLRIAKRHYGWLDPFVIRQDGKLMCRNENATGWTVAKGARELKEAISAEGRPLSEFSYKLDPSPGAYDPVSWEVDRIRAVWAALESQGLRPEVLHFWRRQHLDRIKNHQFPEVKELLGEFQASLVEQEPDQTFSPQA